MGNTRSPTGSSIDRRTLRMANSAKSWPTAWTTRCVRIWKDSRRFAPTGVFVITGACACAVNVRRRPDDVAALLVSPRRREANFQTKSTFPRKNCLFTYVCEELLRKFAPARLRKKEFVNFRLLFFSCAYLYTILFSAFASIILCKPRFI